MMPLPWPSPLAGEGNRRKAAADEGVSSKIRFEMTRFGGTEKGTAGVSKDGPLCLCRV